MLMYIVISPHILTFKFILHINHYGRTLRNYARLHRSVLSLFSRAQKMEDYVLMFPKSFRIPVVDDVIVTAYREGVVADQPDMIVSISI